MALKISRQIVEKSSNIKFHENPPSGSQVVPWRRVDELTDRRTDMTQLIVPFRKCVNAPKIRTVKT